jgi:hypothetical protein
MNEVLEYIESREKFSVWGLATALRLSANEAGDIVLDLYNKNQIIEVSYAGEYAKA